MRIWLGGFSAVCCLAATIGVTYLHGFERALGQLDWQYRPALIEAYSREVVFRAGLCVLAFLSSLIALRLKRSAIWVVALSLVVAVVSVIGTYLTMQSYIVTPPGQLMPPVVWDDIGVLMWVASGILIVSAVVGSQLRRA